MSPRPNRWVNGCNQQNISRVTRWHFSQSARRGKVPPQPNSLHLSEKNRATSSSVICLGKKKIGNLFCHNVLQGLSRLFELQVNEAGGQSVFTLWRFWRFSACFWYFENNIWIFFFFCCIRSSTHHQEIKHTKGCARTLTGHFVRYTLLVWWLVQCIQRCCPLLQTQVVSSGHLNSLCPLHPFWPLTPDNNKAFFSTQLPLTG